MFVIPKNRKGQVLFYAFMVGLVVIILALALAPAIKQSTDTARNTDNMDCDNSSISDFQKGACISTDMTLFYFVGGLIFIGGVIFTAKIMFE